MKTLIELSGNKIAVVEHFLRSTAETLNGLKGDDLVPCRQYISSITIVDHKTGARFELSGSDIIAIADEIRLTTSKTVNIPVYELV